MIPMPINADQISGIDPNVNQFWSMPINADQLLSELIGIETHWDAFRINAMIFIGIGH